MFLARICVWLQKHKFGQNTCIFISCILNNIPAPEPPYICTPFYNFCDIPLHLVNPNNSVQWIGARMSNLR